MKFRLLKVDGQGNKVGPHRMGNKLYRAGQVLESTRPLDTLFRGKFERVTDPNVKVSKPEIVILPKVRGQKEAVVDADGEGQATSPSLPPLDQQMKDQLESHAVTKREKSGETSPNPQGADVTDDFPDADLAAMKVYHNIKSDLFLVVDEKSGEVLKKAKSEELVTKFLKSQLG